MNRNYKLAFFITASLITAAITTSEQSVFAHIRMEVPEIIEAIRASNNIVIGHGSEGEETDLIVTSVALPNGIDSTIIADGQPHVDALTDFVQN